VRLARPGGWVASLEPDTEYALCYPAHPAYTRIRELFRAAFGRHGADPFIGRRLADMYRQAGLRDIGVEARAWPASRSLMPWTGRCGAISMTRASWWCRTCPS
jgi:hypothetical protein